MKRDKHDSADDSQLAREMSTGQWALALFAIAIPLLSIIILIIWAIQLRADPSEKC